MAAIREVIEKYPYVAMDTEFPGVVAKPVTESYTSDYHYKSLKVNVDLLKIIQLGLSFADENGNLCKECPCWQFNFKFNLDGDMFAQDSIDLLVKSGISFQDHATRGIDPQLFGELLMVSGLVLHAVRTVVDSIALAIQAVIDLIALPVQTAIDPIAFPI